MSFSASSRSMPSLTGPGALVDDRLGLLEAEAGGGADRLDDLIFFSPALVSTTSTVPDSSSAPAPSPPAAGGGSGGGDCRRGDAELLLERLDPLGELETEML